MGREASSVTAQVDWVAPNRKAAAVYAQVDWLAPNRKTGTVGMMVDYAVPPLSGANLLTNPNAESGDTAGWTSAQSEGGDDPFEVRSANPNPYDGSFYFTAGTSGGPSGATKTLSQEVDLLAKGFSVSTLDGSPLIGFGGWQASLSGSDTGQIGLEFLDGPGGSVIGSHFGSVFAPIGWTEQQHVVRVPAGTRAVRFSFTGTKVSGGIDSYLDGAFVVLDSATTTTPPPTTTLPTTTTPPPTTAPPTTTGVPPTTTLPTTTTPPLTTTLPTTTTGVPLQPHPADMNMNFGFTSAEVLSYADDFLHNVDATFPGISLSNRSAWVLKAALMFLLTPGGTYTDIGTVAPVDSQQHPERWISVP